VFNAFTQCGGEYKTCPLFYYYPVFISCVFSNFFFPVELTLLITVIASCVCLFRKSERFYKALERVLSILIQ